MFKYYMGSNSSSSHYFKLTADIDLSGKTWDLNNNTSNNFYGNFNGNGYSIKNLQTGINNYGGLFATINGTVKNVKFFSPNIKSKHGATIGYYNAGTIENIMIFNGYIRSSTQLGAGVCSYNYGQINDCYVEADIEPPYPSINYNNFVSGYSQYYATHWIWDHASGAHWITGDQTLYWKLGLKRVIFKQYDSNLQLYVYGIANSAGGTIKRCVFIGKIYKFGFKSGQLLYYEQNNISTDHVYSCYGNSKDGLNDQRKPSSPAIGDFFSDSCHPGQNGNFTVTSSFHLESSKLVNYKTIYGYPISDKNASYCYYYNSNGFSNGAGSSTSSTNLKNWSYVSGLGSNWNIDPKINNGYPYLKYFYWENQV